jgi:hypothetical protein
MDLRKLLLDATGALPGSSLRSQCERLVGIIAKHPGELPPPPLSTVLQWFRRCSLPAGRLVQIVKAAAAHGRDIDIRNY